MKTMACACGTEVKVGDNCAEVTCWKCAGNYNTPDFSNFNFQKKQEEEEEEETVSPSVHHHNIEVVIKEEDQALVLVDGEEIEVNHVLGLDAKMHWVSDNNFLSKGVRIAISRKINEFAA